jgi:hypothetical protein
MASEKEIHVFEVLEILKNELPACFRKEFEKIGIASYLDIESLSFIGGNCGMLYAR